MDAPKALILALEDWPLAAYMALALRRSGFSVASLCPRDHPLHHTDAVDQCYGFSRAHPLRDLSTAIRGTSPALLVPCDDQSTYAIYDLYERCRRGVGEDAAATMSLVERSLGNPESFEIARKKSLFLRIARECGIRFPETSEIGSLAELKAHCAAASFPVVLKQDGTFGGLGVIVARDRKGAEAAYHRLAVRSKVNAGRELLKQFNLRPALRLMTAPPAIISMQSFVEGRPANSAVACWRGHVLARATVVTLEARPAPNGPATVVEFIRNAEIDRAVDTLVARLGLSGFCGFDFMLDGRSDRAYLLELNPRATSASWLGMKPKSDLCAALYRAVTGRDGVGAAEEAEAPGERAALFPQEWTRQKDSEHVNASYHRVPWEDPRLVSYLVATAMKSGREHKIGLASRLARRFILGRGWDLRPERGEKVVVAINPRPEYRAPLDRSPQGSIRDRRA